MMRGDQQKIYHKGSNGKINAFITLLYPSNKVKFTTSKSRTSYDFINHLRKINHYIKNNKVKRLILVIDNASYKQNNRTIHTKTIRLDDCDIFTKTFAKSKSSGDKSEQKFKERCVCVPITTI
jgi:hypothetical protein